MITQYNKVKFYFLGSGWHLWVRPSSKRVEAFSLDPAYFPLHENNFPKVVKSTALPTLSMQGWKQLTRNIATTTCRKQLRTEIVAEMCIWRYLKILKLLASTGREQKQIEK